MFLQHDNITDNDIVQLVLFLQGRPQFYSFDRACFVVAINVGKTVEQVMRICRDAMITTALIEEAMRVPQFTPQRHEPTAGEIMIF